jgi:hypothetical protein
MISEQARPAGYYDDGAGGVFRELMLNSSNPMQLWVEYDGQARRLDVTLVPVQVPKSDKLLLSVAIDLSTIVSDPVYSLRPKIFAPFDFCASHLNNRLIQ